MITCSRKFWHNILSLKATWGIKSTNSKINVYALLLLNMDFKNYFILFAIIQNL